MVGAGCLHLSLVWEELSRAGIMLGAELQVLAFLSALQALSKGMSLAPCCRAGRHNPAPLR